MVVSLKPSVQGGLHKSHLRKGQRTRDTSLIQLYDQHESKCNTFTDTISVAMTMCGHG
jgi:hypothetical protein